MLASRSLHALALAIAIPSLSIAVTFASLLFADWVEARYRQPTLARQIWYAFDRGHRLHYVGHLAAGRLADLCGCAPRFAEDQYNRATWHARTGRQLALVTVERPARVEDFPSDTLGIANSSARWAHAAVGWLADRAAARVAPTRIWGSG